MIWHLTIEQLPEHFEHATPLELRAPVSTLDATAFVGNFVNAVDLPKDRVELIVEPEHWPPSFG